MKKMIFFVSFFVFFSLTHWTGYSQDVKKNNLLWTSSAALPFPEISVTGDRHIAYKDPSIVRAKDAWHIYASRGSYKNGITSYSLVYLGFPDWDKASKAKVVPILTNEKMACAPHIIYFTPKKKWYIIYFWWDRKTQYSGPAFSTVDDIDRPETFSAPQACFSKKPESLPKKKNWLDFTVIADSQKAYLFFTNNEGDFLRAETSLKDFPLGWNEPVVLLSAPTTEIFEASETYKIKDSKEYLTIIEGIGPQGRRYFNSYLANKLDGEWHSTGSSFEHPFAGCKNVEYPKGSDPWSVNISHGELIRASTDETMLLDMKHLEFLYQGWDFKTRVEGIPLGKYNGYHEAPWKLGILRAK